MALVAVVLVVLSIFAAIVAARHVQALKNTLSRLKAKLQETESRLAEAKIQRETVEGTVGMLENIKKDKIHSHEKLLQELEDLKEEVVEEREIKEKNPRTKSRSDPI